MKRFNIYCISLLVLGILFTKSHSILYSIRPDSVNIDASKWFIRPTESINVLWWLKGISDELMMCIVFYVMAQLSKLLHKNLYYACCIFFAYYIFNVLMFIYNYKQSRWLFHVAFVVCVAALVSLFIPVKSKSKVKFLQ